MRIRSTWGLGLRWNGMAFAAITLILVGMGFTQHPPQRIIARRVVNKQVVRLVETPPPTPIPTAHPVVIEVKKPPQPASGSIWDCIAKHESGMRWSLNNPPYEGGLQFLHSTWVSAGGRKYAEHAYQATREQQIAIAASWLKKTSWAQWPNTSRMCGVR